MTLSFGLVLWFALFAMLGAVGTWAARAYALHRRLLDEPGERRSHRVATPRGGGIAIVLAFLVAIAAMIVRHPAEIVLLVCAGFGFLLVAGIGWLDDHRPLSPWSRLAVHTVAAGWLAVGFYLSGAGGAVALIAFVAALVLVNIWNFMDGIDGLAATQAALAAAALAVLTGGDALAIHLGLALVGATFGFLPFNAPRARIFLGDVGSGALGFALALMVGLSLDAAPRAAWPLAILPLSACVLDAGLTLLSRMLRGERWWTAHVEHAYQRWARRAGGHMRVTAAYVLWTLFACVIMIWLGGENFGGQHLWERDPEGQQQKGIVMVVAMWLASGSVLWYWLRGRLGAGLVNELSNERPANETSANDKPANDRMDA